MNCCLHSGVLVDRNMSHRTHQTIGTTKLAELSPLCTWKISFRLRIPPNSKSQVPVWVFFSNDGMARLSVTLSVSQTRVQAHTVATLKLVRQRNSSQDSEVSLSFQPCLPGSSLGHLSSSSSTPRQALQSPRQLPLLWSLMMLRGHAELSRLPTCGEHTDSWTNLRQISEILVLKKPCGMAFWASRPIGSSLLPQ